MRFPFDPLVPHIEAQWTPPADATIGHIGIVGKAASVLHVNRSQVYRWQQYGLDDDQADKAAYALGLWPGDLWSEWGQWDYDLWKPDRRSTRSQPPYQPCGTYAAFQRHLRHGTKVCARCAEARRAYERARHYKLLADPVKAELRREWDRERKRRQREAAA